MSKLYQYHENKSKYGELKRSTTENIILSIEYVGLGRPRNVINIYDDLKFDFIKKNKKILPMDLPTKLKDPVNKLIVFTSIQNYSCDGLQVSGLTEFHMFITYHKFKKSTINSKCLPKEIRSAMSKVVDYVIEYIYKNNETD